MEPYHVCSTRLCCSYDQSSWINRGQFRIPRGGVPYQDIITGINYVVNKYNYLDGDKICAAGGSYGGYMINWINGHTNMFKCLVNHDGAFSVISKFYGTEELWFQKAEFCPTDKIGCNPFDGKEIRGKICSKLEYTYACYSWRKRYESSFN